MDISVEEASGTCSLALAGELTIHHSAAVKERLLASIRACARVDVDLSSVTDIDTAGMQVLLIAKREAEASGARLQLGGLSAAVLDLVGLFNLADQFVPPVAQGVQP